MAKKAWMEKVKRKPKFKVRAYYRCQRCGRSRGTLRKFRLCRICFRELAETDAAQPELAERSPAPAAALAPVVGAHLELRLPLDLLHPRLLRHPMVSYATATGASPRKGMPISRSSAIAVSSRPALVTNVISIPWIFSTLS